MTKIEMELDVKIESVLLTGNTQYISLEFLEKAFPNQRVVIVGETGLKSNRRKKITVFPAGRVGEIEQLFQSYDFKQAVYFSNYLTLHGKLDGEADLLRRFLKACEQTDTEVLYVTSLETIFTQKTGKTVLVESAEHICVHYAQSQNISLKILRIPFLYSGRSREDFLCKCFEGLYDKKKLSFMERKEQRLFFLSIEDLGELLYRIFERFSKEEVEILNVLNTPDGCFEDLAEALKKLEGECEIDFRNTAALEEIPKDDELLRKRYHWFPRRLFLEELPFLYESYKKSRVNKRISFRAILKKLKVNRFSLKLLELFIGSGLIEIINLLTGVQVQFRMVDFRLLFIIIIASIYGINLGILAALLESIILCFAYIKEGTNFLTLFYEPMNWLPFIAYMMTGAVCGYVRMKTEDDNRFLKAENKLIQDRYQFVNQLYQDTLEEKRQYKKQIIGSKDSFGKIFEVSRRLDQLRPEEVFAKSIEIMEEILENHSVSIYSVGKNKNFARLEVASKEIIKETARSIRMEDYSLALDSLKENSVWSNTELRTDYPMYLAGIYRGEELVMLIQIRDTAYSQNSLYYQNLIKILCGLIKISLLRAMDYQELKSMENYISGTHILNMSAFMEKIHIYHGIQESLKARYTILRLISPPDRTIEEMDHLLENMIRENDVIGLADDGNLYLLLMQSTSEDAEIVRKRLETVGIGSETALFGQEEENDG